MGTSQLNIWTFRNWQLAIGLLAGWAASNSLQAQIDPAERNLLQLGANQSLKNDGPRAIYAFYYWNNVDFPRTNQTLRLVIAPGYIDGEIGFKGLLGEHTDLGIGLAGGGFANSHEEVRQGNYFKDESYDGHGGGPSVSLYHLLNPEYTIPLSLLVRGGVDYHLFEDRSDTGNGFKVPDDQPFYYFRTGLRWGGSEPVLWPRLALELSAWYEMHYRQDAGNYGFANDRELESDSHQLWARAQLNFTVPNSEEHYIMLGLIGGSVLDADRLSAFRLGGALPFTAEFPLYLPGYFYKELSAENFGILYGNYTLPLGAQKRWSLTAGGATALVDYIDEFSQPGHWHSGIQAMIGYQAKNQRWKTNLGFGYGIDAIRSDGRGGYSLGLLFQYNFGELETLSDRAYRELKIQRDSRGAFR